jgi:Xaa-Pro aminopeptidase
MWPRPSPPSAFAERRRRLQGLLEGPALIASGLGRPRNFPANRYPFRAESHFLYLTGAALEGAVVLVTPDRCTLYAPRPDPDAALWSGQQPSLAELEAERGIMVRPIEELAVPAETAVLPPQDADSALWLGDLMDRDIEPGRGDRVEGADARLAQAMIELRLRHDAAALDQLRQAAAVAELAHRAGMRATRPGKREAEVRAAMEAAIIASGMCPSYNSIVTVHGEVLHNEHHHNLAGQDDLLLADVGAETPEGWASDVTRTWPAAGKFSGTQRALYEVVLAAQLAAIGAVCPGASYRAIHRQTGKKLVEGLLALGILRGDADDLYERGAAALFFPHGVGHLLGLDVHDMEDLGDRAGYAPGRTRSTHAGDRYLRLDRDLEAGMVVTIEPGFYQIPRLLADPAEVGNLESALARDVLARFSDVRGIRIEDDVLVTESGSDVLTRCTPKTAAEVEAAVAGA